MWKVMDRKWLGEQVSHSRITTLSARLTQKSHTMLLTIIHYFNKKNCLKTMFKVTSDLNSFQKAIDINPMSNNNMGQIICYNVCFYFIDKVHINLTWIALST